MTILLIFSILMFFIGIFIVIAIIKTGKANENQVWINIGNAMIIVGLFFSIVIILLLLNII